MKIEYWRPIPGYEGYEVSNLGRVKGKERILKPSKDKDGYLAVGLYKSGQRKNFKVHRLVAIAFIPNPDKLPCINHKDENPGNNAVSNLEWCTQKYNV